MDEKDKEHPKLQKDIHDDLKSRSKRDADCRVRRIENQLHAWKRIKRSINYCKPKQK